MARRTTICIDLLSLRLESTIIIILLAASHHPAPPPPPSPASAGFDLSLKLLQFRWFCLVALLKRRHSGSQLITTNHFGFVLKELLRTWVWIIFRAVPTYYSLVIGLGYGTQWESHTLRRIKPNDPLTSSTSEITLCSWVHVLSSGISLPLSKKCCTPLWESRDIMISHVL